MSEIKMWECPECGITENPNVMFVPEKTFEGHEYTCDHCFENWGERVVMEAKK